MDYLPSLFIFLLLSLLVLFERGMEFLDLLTITFSLSSKVVNFMDKDAFVGLNSRLHARQSSLCKQNTYWSLEDAGNLSLMRVCCRETSCN